MTSPYPLATPNAGTSRCSSPFDKHCLSSNAMFQPQPAAAQRRHRRLPSGTMVSYAEVKSYLSKREIPQLFESLMAGLMYHRPENHIGYLQTCLDEVKSNSDAKVHWSTFVNKKRKSKEILPPLTPPKKQDSFSSSWSDNSRQSTPLPPISAKTRTSRDVKNTYILYHNPPPVLAKPRVPVVSVLGGLGSRIDELCQRVVGRLGGVVHISTCSMLKTRMTIEGFYRVTSVPACAVVDSVLQAMSMVQSANALLVAGFPRSRGDIEEYRSRRVRMDGVVLVDFEEEALRRFLKSEVSSGAIRIGDIESELERYKQDIISVAEYYDEKDILTVVMGDQDTDEMIEDMVMAVDKIIETRKHIQDEDSAIDVVANHDCSPCKSLVPTPNGLERPSTVEIRDATEEDIKSIEAASRNSKEDVEVDDEASEKDVLKEDLNQVSDTTELSKALSTKDTLEAVDVTKTSSVTYKQPKVPIIFSFENIKTDCETLKDLIVNEMGMCYINFYELVRSDGDKDDRLDTNESLNLLQSVLQRDSVSYASGFFISDFPFDLLKESKFENILKLGDVSFVCKVREKSFETEIDERRQKEDLLFQSPMSEQVRIIFVTESNVVDELKSSLQEIVNKAEFSENTIEKTGRADFADVVISAQEIELKKTSVSIDKEAIQDNGEHDMDEKSKTDFADVVISVQEVELKKASVSIDKEAIQDNGKDDMEESSKTDFADVVISAQEMELKNTIVSIDKEAIQDNGKDDMEESSKTDFADVVISAQEMELNKTSVSIDKAMQDNGKDNIQDTSKTDFADVVISAQEKELKKTSVSIDKEAMQDNGKDNIQDTSKTDFADVVISAQEKELKKTSVSIDKEAMQDNGEHDMEKASKVDFTDVVISAIEMELKKTSGSTDKEETIQGSKEHDIKQLASEANTALNNDNKDDPGETGKLPNGDNEIDRNDELENQESVKDDDGLTSRDENEESTCQDVEDIITDDTLDDVMKPLDVLQTEDTVDMSQIETEMEDTLSQASESGMISLDVHKEKPVLERQQNLDVETTSTSNSTTQLVKDPESKGETREKDNGQYETEGRIKLIRQETFVSSHGTIHESEEPLSDGTKDKEENGEREENAVENQQPDIVGNDSKSENEPLSSQTSEQKEEISLTTENKLDPVDNQELVKNQISDNENPEVENSQSVENCEEGIEPSEDADKESSVNVDSDGNHEDNEDSSEESGKTENENNLSEKQEESSKPENASVLEETNTKPENSDECENGNEAAQQISEEIKESSDISLPDGENNEDQSDKKLSDNDDKEKGEANNELKVSSDETSTDSENSQIDTSKQDLISDKGSNSQDDSKSEKKNYQMDDEDAIINTEESKDKEGNGCEEKITTDENNEDDECKETVHIEITTNESDCAPEILKSIDNDSDSNDEIGNKSITIETHAEVHAPDSESPPLIQETDNVQETLSIKENDDTPETQSIQEADDVQETTDNQETQSIEDGCPLLSENNPAVVENENFIIVDTDVIEEENDLLDCEIDSETCQTLEKSTMQKQITSETTEESQVTTIQEIDVLRSERYSAKIQERNGSGILGESRQEDHSGTDEPQERSSSSSRGEL